jgi:hypothetical protein
MAKKSVWTREHPKPPEQDPPDVYWFKYDDEEYECTVDIWPDRKWWPKGWWGEKITRSAERPPKTPPKQKKKAK